MIVLGMVHTRCALVDSDDTTMIPENCVKSLKTSWGNYGELGGAHVYDFALSQPHWTVLGSVVADRDAQAEATVTKLIYRF
jgi:hypothetical protein